MAPPHVGSLRNTDKICVMGSIVWRLRSPENGRSWGILLVGRLQMCVINYLVSGTSRLRMPMLPRGVDSIAIRWSGDVLQGRLSVREAVTSERVGRTQSDQTREIPRAPRRPLGWT
jgi:hypothetical protein